MITSFVLYLPWTAAICLWCTCPSYPLVELIIFKPPNILDKKVTLFSFLCSDLLSSDYVEIHYKNGKPQYSKVW